MASPGYVYALINPSMQGLVKVGRTARNPTDRASELSGATGVPTPFIVVYHECFANCEDAEAFVHMMLQQQGYRISDAREFFNAEIAAVIKTIAACPGKITQEKLVVATHDAAEIEICSNTLIDEMLERAMNLENGDGGEFQDYDEAVQVYRQAAKLGSSEALKCIGDMYMLGRGVPENIDRAYEYYKDAKNKGCIGGYVGMASVFSLRRNESNFRKCWIDLFVDYGDVDAFTCFEYFVKYKMSGWKISNIPAQIYQERDEIIKIADRLIERGSDIIPYRAVGRLIIEELFPELCSDSIYPVDYAYILSANGFYSVPGYASIYRSSKARVCVQILLDKWSIDEHGASGDSPASLANFLDRLLG